MAALSSQIDATRAEPRGAVRAWLRLARPEQWIKNLLVFVPVGAAGVLDRADPFLHALATFGLFCVAASSTYCVNDALDAKRDQAHPTKRHRPVAAGQISPSAAMAVAIVGFGVAIAGGWALSGWRLGVVIASYVLVSVSYSVWLKHVPVIELSAVAAGFVLRAVAGGVATSVDLSKWFLVVISFGALFLVIGKRAGEQKELGEDHHLHRGTLEDYSPDFLRAALTLTAAGAVTTYCLWAFDKGAAGLAQHANHLVYIELSVAPVVTGVLYMLRILFAGGGGSPTRLALEDRTLLGLGAVWGILVICGVYA